ncbi:hypothetical protein FA95DRAFT_1565108 [Auriscalpium vulgare]|uniref:Uncharacterized protein n=1 Tax=Auriscalpium vulgare TaxID=40419 RepID=A0ACB8RDP0_9AGAM|nr:hypothetical protein FA95DRAFT_1565108 [Auriscalpium vulgare]
MAAQGWLVAQDVLAGLRAPECLPAALSYAAVSSTLPTAAIALIEASTGGPVSQSGRASRAVGGE